MLAKYRIGTKVIVAAVLAVGVVVSSGLYSLAQTGDQTGTANTMRVSPTRTDVSMDPGETREVEVIVTNPTDLDVSVRPIQNDFIAGDERGTPALILDEDEYAPNHSLKRFMQPLNNVRVPAGESRTVTVTIEVPNDAEAGGYFGAIRFAPVSPDEGGQVNLSASVASLILLRVNGEVPERLNVTDFSIRKDDNPGDLFTDGSNITAHIRFQNEGGVQLTPFGKLSVLRGNEVVHDVDFNNKDQRDAILPDSARQWDVELKNVDGFGKYTVSGTFTYGSTNQTVEVTKSFWVVPWYVTVGAVVALLVLIGAIVALVRNGRKRADRMKFGK